MANENKTAYEELVAFLTSGPTREQITRFHASNTTRRRVNYLMDASRAGTLTPEERFELDEFARIERFIEQLKLRAQHRRPHA